VPTVDYYDPEPVGVLYGPDGELLAVVEEPRRYPFGFAPPTR
jgi:hypothetical protein